MKPSWHRTLVRAAVRFILLAAFIFGLGMFVSWSLEHMVEGFVVCLIVTVLLLFCGGARLIEAVFATADRRHE